MAGDDIMTADSEVERAKMRVRDAIARLASSGRFSADDFLVYDEEVRGRPSIMLRRDAHHSEGISKHSCHLGHDHADIAAGEGSLRFLGRFVEGYGRLHDRDRVLAAAGCDPLDPPSWSFDAHVMTLGMMRHIGVDVSTAVPMTDVRLLGGRVSTLQGQVNALQDATAEILHYRSHLSVRRLTIIGGDGRPALTLQDIADDGPMLHIRNGDGVPATVLNTMAGLPLSRIVAHPSLDEAGDLRIRHATVSDGLLKLGIEQRRRPIAQPPDGVDAVWTRP